MLDNRATIRTTFNDRQTDLALRQINLANDLGADFQWFGNDICLVWRVNSVHS